MPIQVIPLGNGPTGFGMFPEDAALIGELVVKCSWLDRFALTALRNYLGIEMAVAERVFSRDAGSSLRLRLRNAVDEIENDPDVRSDWDRWLNDVQNVSEERNEIVHSLWAFGPNGMEGTRLRTKGARAVDFDQAKTRELINRCGVLNARWGALLARRERPDHGRTT